MSGSITTTETTSTEHPRRRRARVTKSERTVFPATRVGPPAHVSTDGHRLRAAHDIGHACGTLLMLAAALESTELLDPVSRSFLDQLGTETRRVNELVTDLFHGPHEQPTTQAAVPVRLDAIIQSIADPIRVSSGIDIDVCVPDVRVEQDSLELWRVLRNLICNALEAVGPDGHIRIRLTVRDSFAVVDIDDDGPGVAESPPRSGALGLRIVEDFVAGWGGWFEIGTGSLGGCRARLMVPVARRVGAVG